MLNDSIAMIDSEHLARPLYNYNIVGREQKDGHSGPFGKVMSLGVRFQA